LFFDVLRLRVLPLHRRHVHAMKERANWARPERVAGQIVVPLRARCEAFRRDGSETCTRAASHVVIARTHSGTVQVVFTCAEHAPADDTSPITTD
jgi:hypothetical protein